jgi:predicted N-acetyltransferase YhbS
MEIRALQFEDDLWNSFIQYAENCSWEAGPFLAKQMRENRFSDWEMIFVATEDTNILGYCTIAKKDCIPNVIYTPYIGFVFVGEEYRGNRISEQLVKFALAYAENIGFKEVFLVSGEEGLYEKYGFTKIDDKKDFGGNDQQIFRIDI